MEVHPELLEWAVVTMLPLYQSEFQQADEVVLRTATELLLEQASWRSYEDAVVALVEPSATLWGPDRARAMLPPDLSTRGLPDDAEATTIEALDPRQAAAGPSALPGNLTLRRVESASELRARDSAGRQRLTGADARIRIQEARRRPDGSAIIHLEVMTDGPHDRLFAVTYDLTMERSGDTWVVADVRRFSIT